MPTEQQKLQLSFAFWQPHLYFLVSSNFSKANVLSNEIWLALNLNVNRLVLCYIIIRDDEEIREKDGIMKEKGREYGDIRKKAKTNNISIGDQVVVENISKIKKLSTNFAPEPHMLVDKRQSDVLVLNHESGKEYRRHVTQVKRFHESTTNSLDPSSIQSTSNE